jgi:hypothetical protein
MTPRRIAMWSGPRNISTAMMRAWENRGDCMVSDEPLYAHYLLHTGLDHPGAEEVIATGQTDWRRVVNALTGPIPEAKDLWYQKHMTHHLLPQMDRDWVHTLDNVFLIRDPAGVVASYTRKRASVTPEDIGLPQQVELFDQIAQRLGSAPPVIDADDFLRDPEVQLRTLCGRLDLPFSMRMLRWPPGPRASDGIWAKHWYDAVWASSRFEHWRPRATRLDGDAARVAERCLPLYERLREHRIAAG